MVNRQNYLGFFKSQNFKEKEKNTLKDLEEELKNRKKEKKNYNSNHTYENDNYLKDSDRIPYFNIIFYF